MGLDFDSLQNLLFKIGFPPMKTKRKSGKVLRGRAAGIVLEDLDSKLDLVVEKVESSEQRVLGEVSEIKGKISTIEKDITDIRVLLYRQDGRIEKQHEILEKHEEEISILKASARH